MPPGKKGLAFGGSGSGRSKNTSLKVSGADNQRAADSKGKGSSHLHTPITTYSMNVACPEAEQIICKRYASNLLRCAALERFTADCAPFSDQRFQFARIDTARHTRTPTIMQDIRRRSF